METQWVQGFLTLSLSSLGGLLFFFLFPNLKREAEARGCAMSAEKVKKKKRQSVRLWIFLDLLLFVVEPCLIILGGIFIMSGLLKFRFGMHLFQDIFSTLWFRRRVQKGRIKVHNYRECIDIPAVDTLLFSSSQCGNSVWGHPLLLSWCSEWWVCWRVADQRMKAGTEQVI